MLKKLIAWIGRRRPTLWPTLFRFELHGGPLDGLEGDLARSQIRRGIWPAPWTTTTIARYSFETPPETELVDGDPLLVWHGRHVGYAVRARGLGIAK